MTRLAQPSRRASVASNARRGPGPRGRSRWGVVLLIALLASSTTWFAASRDTSAAAAGTAPPVTSGPVREASTTPVIFDNFNRTNSTSWGVQWLTNIQPGVNCPGQVASVDGQAGRISTVATGGCGLEGAIEARSDGRWKHVPGWAFTGKFKVDSLGSFGRLEFNVRRSGGERMTAVTLDFGSGSTFAQLWCNECWLWDWQSTPMTWQQNVWYSIKFVHVWNDQARLKIWPSSQSEPTEWLLAKNAEDSMDYLAGSYFQVIWATSTSESTGNVQVDDFAFADAPLLPKLPPPAGTEHNPPYVNEANAGDPVSTLTGAYSDRHVDVALPGRGPAIEFARAYNSNDTRATTLGPGWTHSYNIRLVSPGDGTNDVILIGPEGRSDRYVSTGSAYTPPPGVHRTLTKNPDDTYVATDKTQTKWSFDPAGILTEIRDRYGNVSTLTYDTSNRLIGVSDPGGRGTLTLAYTNGLLTTVTDWGSPARTVTYQYDGTGRLWKVTDRENKTTTFTYDGSSQRIATVTDARGNVTLTNSYDGQGRVATQKDGRGVLTGESTTFAYVTNGDGTTTTTLTLPPTSFEPSFQPTLADTYDVNGWLIGRVTRPSTADTLTQSFTYDTAGNQTSATDPRGARTDYCYDVDYAGVAIPGGAANLTRTIEPAAAAGMPRAVTLNQYDTKSNLIQTVSPRGVPSGLTPTCSTNLATINSLYAVDSTYDAAGVALLASTRRFTDPDSGAKPATTKYEYGDAANPGRVTRVIPPRGNTSGTPDYTYATAMSYFTTGTSSGLLKDITDPLGNRTSYTYDAVGRVVTIVDPIGNAAGGVPTDHTTTFNYDKEDRLRTTSQPAPKAGGTLLVSETQFDAVGNPIFRINANGQVTGLTYDERNSLATVTESAAPWTNPAVGPTTPIVTAYEHDAGGNATRVTRAQGDTSNERVTDYTFDGRGLRRSEKQYPAWPSTSGALVTETIYDSDGNPLTVTDPMGRTTTFAHDARNQLTGIDYSDPGTPDVVLGYDLDGNRVSMTDGTGTSSFVFDESGQPVSATSPGPKTVGYRYDLDGHRAKLIYPDATAVNYTFDKAGRMASLSDWASRNVTYTYWPDGLVKGSTLPDGTGVSYAYDNARRLVDILHQRLATTISHQAYTLDRVGNVTNMTDYVTGVTPVPVWSAAGAVNNVTTAQQTQPAITLGTDGAVFAAWADTRTGDSDIYFSRRDPTTGTWSASERVNHVTSGAQTQPAIVFDPSGQDTSEGPGGLWVVWTDTRNGAADDDIYWTRRRPDGTWWSGDYRLNDDGAGKRQYSPAIAIRPDGGGMAIWYDERGGGSKKNIYSASLGLTANFKVTSDANAAKGEPKLVVDSAGVAYAVWRDNRSGNADVWFATLPADSGTWSSNTKISDDPGSALQDAPAIGLDSAGNVTVVWNDARTTPSQIRARIRLAATGIWSPSVVVGGSTSNAPSISVRPDGRALAAWSNGTLGTLTTLWGSQYEPTNGTWSSPEQLTVGTEEAAAATVGYSTDQLVVAYQRRPSGGDYDIYSRRKSLVGDVSAFGYDSLDRLTSVAGPDGSRSYAYDPVGNRLTRVAGATTSYVYDRADRLTSAGGVAVTSDANGNVLGRGSDTYSYDQANRLSTATVGGSTETYAYDGLGTRFSRQIGAGTPIRYVNDVAGGLPTVIDDASHKFVYGLGLAYAASGSGIEVYHTDRLESIRSTTDATGNVMSAMRRDEWGLTTASTGSSTQPFGYTGEPTDPTGLTYLRARYYNAELGRFMSRDTWFGSPSSPQSLDRYAYVADNPMTRSDPSGHCGIDAFADVAFLVYDVGALAFGPPKDQGGNWLALGADASGLFIPCATGLGLAVRAGREAAEHADDVAHGIGWLDDFARAACSFTPETLVATPKGQVQISTIKAGDTVFAWDQVSGDVVPRVVTAVWPHRDDSIARVTLAGDVVTTTPDHPFYTLEQGWVEAGVLWPGAHVKTAAGADVVSAVETRPFDGTLWDLTVDQAHNFFVGRIASLVHNCAADDLGPTLDRIGRGEVFPHVNDGGVFRNAEGRLPSRPQGYYHEYVHPTPGVQGPGLQRVVVGDGGDVWFTPDHYQTFVRIR